MHSPSTGSSKTDRISIRLEENTKRRIERAAALDHRSLTSFIIASAVASAEKLLQRSDSVMLGEEDWRRFYDALVHPPKPNKALKKAFANYTALNIGSDA